MTSPFLLNYIVLHPLIYVLFHSSYWFQTELGEEKLLENWTLVSTILKLNAIKTVFVLYYLITLMLQNLHACNSDNCLIKPPCLYLNFHNYPHIIKFVCI